MMAVTWTPVLNIQEEKSYSSGSRHLRNIGCVLLVQRLKDSHHTTVLYLVHVIIMQYMYMIRIITQASLQKKPKNITLNQH